MEEQASPPQPIEIVVRYQEKSGGQYRSSEVNRRNDGDGYDSESGNEEFHPAAEDPNLSSNDEDGDGRDDLILKHRRHRAVERRLTSLSDGSMDELSETDEDLKFCFPALDSAKETAEHFVKKVWEASWKATHFYSLPEWLQDNDFLHTGHRPPLPSFTACLKSIFRVHTETGNIWTHMIGCVFFVGIAIYFFTRPHNVIQWQDKLAFSPFFLGAIACLGLSFAFHTVYCHSERVGKLFSKLDYVGISLLIMGSFVPWLYYSFYCRLQPKYTYMITISVLGSFAIVVSLWDKFSEPLFRPLRAGVFMALGLFGVVPAVHFIITDGYSAAIKETSFHWLVLMACLYIGGALLYAMRIPERFFPGKCDIWFQSHQLFHLCVVVAAFVHYHGVTEMAMKRLSGGTCEEMAQAMLS